MYAVFHHQEFTHFAGMAYKVIREPASKGLEAVPMSDEQLRRLRAIYRCGFAATATRGPGGSLSLSPTTERRPVAVRVWVRPEEGGGLGHVPDLHTYAQEAAGELVAAELEKITAGRVVLTPAQAEARAQAAVGELLTSHPYPTRPHLLETFQGLWTAAHVDMRAPLAEGLRTALTKLKERGVAKQVEKALIAATVQRAAETAAETAAIAA